MLQDSDKQPAFKFGNHTDVGQVRPQNEDYMGYFNTLNGHLFVVCDGMGGHVGGAVASQMAVQSIRDYAQQQYYPNPNDVLNGAVRYANHRIYQEAQLKPELYGMGTTCVVVLIRSNFAYYAHVGDSRIYLFRNETFEQITKDHSFVQTLIEQGVISKQEARNHPRKNEILQALGTHMEVETEVAPEPLVTRNNDIILLCTDGLTDMITDDGIAEVVKSDLSVQHKAMKLIQLANDAGGLDNITAQLIEFPKDNSFQEYADPMSQTNPFEKKRVTQVNQSSSTPQGDFTQKKSEINPIAPITEATDKVKFSMPALLVLALLAAGTAYMYFNPDSPVMQKLATKRDKLIHKNPSDTTKVSKKIKKKAFEILAKEFPIFQELKNKYDKTKETIDDLKEKRDRLRELLATWDSVATNPLRGDETLEEMADKYDVSVDLLQEANEISSDEELQQLDTLYIPIEETGQ